MSITGCVCISNVPEMYLNHDIGMVTGDYIPDVGCGQGCKLMPGTFGKDT
jgi:hypothetical protein